jgi:alkylation response protein AidB-like acyl-CoA dehydrogenase
MELKFSKKEEKFRSELRDWIEENVLTFPIDGSSVPTHLTEDEVELQKSWQRMLYRGGYSGIHWPKEYGGRGASLKEQLIFYDELTRVNAPDITNRLAMHFVGQQHAGPTIMVHGTEEQKKKHLPKILQGEEIWCQGFSEPNAGSDLANIQTRAELKGDKFIINGQKTWSSFANVSDYCEMMVRTDPTASKHKGISFLLVDMKSPGITIRPIVQITGDDDFCEVFFDNVEVPVENLVGKLNDGWRVGMTTLGFERGTAFLQKQLWLQYWVKEAGSLLKDARMKGSIDEKDFDEFVSRLLPLYSEALALKAISYRTIGLMEEKGTPGAEGSIVKIMWSELEQRITRLVKDIKKWQSIFTEGDMGPFNDIWQYRYLRSYARTIAAGSSEIQRNIVAERVLGLPRA